MDYCCSVWGTTTAQNIDRIIKLHKSAAIIILNATFEDSSNDLFVTLGWKTFDRHVLYRRWIMVYSQLMV